MDELSLQMRILLTLTLCFLLCSCAIKFGDIKQGGVIDYLEKNYDTKIRSPMPRAGMYLNMSGHLYTAVVNYCTSHHGQLIEGWCVDGSPVPLFYVAWVGGGTLPVMVNGSMMMMQDSRLLTVHERKNAMTDREWLDIAINRLGFNPTVINAAAKKE